MTPTPQAPFMARLGLLAVASSTGVVTLYSLPHPEALCSSQNNADCSQDAGTVAEPGKQTSRKRAAASSRGQCCLLNTVMVLPVLSGPQHRSHEQQLR